MTALVDLCVSLVCSAAVFPVMPAGIGGWDNGWVVEGMW